MCKLFIQADSQLWQSSTRSLRIDGMVTREASIKSPLLSLIRNSVKQGVTLM
ncbi:hypothetical protein [Marinomonas sp. PE14-40]|uniref:hypothetical protein n=1 Tax=Marinomonas sp. PE14-40 TaxID=3060621 RepID=UPI003F67C278